MKGVKQMTPGEILKMYEDANEMHFHDVDRKWIMEAIEDYAEQERRKAWEAASELAVQRGTIVRKFDDYEDWRKEVEK